MLPLYENKHMPRKKKSEELDSWLNQCTAASINVIFENYSFVVTIVVIGGHRSDTEYIKRARELYPNAKDYGFLNLSSRVHA